jgi:hypothetical protein
MAKTSNRTDMPKIKKQTPIKGAAGKAAKISNEWIMPQNATDVAMLLFPYGKVAKGVGRAVKKVIKPAAKVKKVVPAKSPAKTANKMVKNIKKTKPLENVPTGVSNRYQATLQRLAAEEAKKKKK